MPDNPITNQTDIPVCTAGVCLGILHEYIENQRPALKSFYDADSLMQRALRAEGMIKTLIRRGCDHRTAEQLSLLVLFDLVILVDDSLSMGNAEGGATVTTLKRILKQIAKVYDLANPGIGISSIRFLNQELGKRNITSKKVDKVLENHQFNGIANIGTMLDKRILERFIYNRPFRLPKPLIFMMIIHSEVEGESDDTLERVINDCVLECKASSTLGEGAATFLISRIGYDEGAERFLKRLTSRGIQNLYCFPPYVPLEGLDDTLIIWKTLKGLFVDALYDTSYQGKAILIGSNELGQEEEDILANIPKKEGHDQLQDVLGQENENPFFSLRKQAIQPEFFDPACELSYVSSEFPQNHLQQCWQEDESLWLDKPKQGADRLQELLGPDDQNSFQDSLKKSYSKAFPQSVFDCLFTPSPFKPVEEEKNIPPKDNELRQVTENWHQHLSAPDFFHDLPQTPAQSGKSTEPVPFSPFCHEERRTHPGRSMSYADFLNWDGSEVEVTKERSPSPPAEQPFSWGRKKRRRRPRRSTSWSDLSDWASADEDVEERSPSPPAPKTSGRRETDANRNRGYPAPGKSEDRVTQKRVRADRCLRRVDQTTQDREKTSKIVFRVRGIPYGKSLRSISVALSASPLKLRSKDIWMDVDESTIVPDCYGSNTQMALIQFIPRPPDELQSLRINETYTLRLYRSGEQITVDKDFFGHTQLYPTTGQIAADIVAVCGLNGHPYGSWAAKANADGRTRMWLRHFLPKSLHHCRTMVYGYNSNLQHQSRHSIQDYVDTFLEELEKTRNSKEERERPVILIAHSFGGIVIAHSIANATEKQLKCGSLISNIKGIVFFGTPHRGLVVDDLLAMIGDQSSRLKMVQDLSPDSLVLHATLEKFIKICEEKEWKIVSFRERGQTRKLVKDEYGVWARTGDHYTAVESESLVLNLPNSIEETLPAEGDHSTMVKFGHEHHSTYTSLLRKLNELIFKKGYGRRQRSSSFSGSDSEGEGIRKRTKPICK